MIFMFKIAILFVCLAFYVRISAGQSAIPDSKSLNLNNSIALNGYDPVSYFSSNPRKGNMQFSIKYQDATYFFTTKANLEIFINAPEKYIPEYGGWCAYAMGKSGEKVEVNPETYKIIEGKLYLFYNSYFSNTLKSWNKNEAE